jgi:predicted dehydrogenase
LNTPVIVCEKPICANVQELTEIHALKQQSASKVLVNYFRRFHPVYHSLKEVLKKQDLTNIQVTYQRGFLNNATHALDTLNFLYGFNELSEIMIGNYSFDEFEYDPTISLNAKYNNIPITFLGLQHVKYSLFEIRLYLAMGMVTILNNGNDVRFYAANNSSANGYYPVLEKSVSIFDNVDAIKDPFLHFMSAVKKYITEPGDADNFEESFLLNLQSLKIVQQCPN